MVRLDGQPWRLPARRARPCRATAEHFPCKPYSRAAGEGDRCSHDEDGEGAPRTVDLPQAKVVLTTTTTTAVAAGVNHRRDGEGCQLVLPLDSSEMHRSAGNEVSSDERSDATTGAMRPRQCSPSPFPLALALFRFPLDPVLGSTGSTGRQMRPSPSYWSSVCEDAVLGALISSAL